jgi:hypothetical protein
MAVTDVCSWDFGSAGVKEVRTSLDVSLGISDAKRHLCMHIRNNGHWRASLMPYFISVVIY